MLRPSDDNSAFGHVRPLSLILLLSLALPSGVSAHRPTKEFDLLKSRAALSGRETVIVKILSQADVIERAFRSEVTCRGQSGFEKANTLATDLNRQISESPTFAGHATVTAVMLPLFGDGRLEGRIPEADAFVFTDIRSFPCKEGAEHEVDKINTLTLKVGSLQLVDRTSMGTLNVEVDDIPVAVVTDGKSLNAVLRDVASALGRPSAVQGAKLLIPLTRSIQVTTTDPRLNLAFGLLERCDANGDFEVDAKDLAAILEARNTVAAPGDPRDPDDDGLITRRDFRICALGCTTATCDP